MIVLQRKSKPTIPDTKIVDNVAAVADSKKMPASTVVVSSKKNSDNSASVVEEGKSTYNPARPYTSLLDLNSDLSTQVNKKYIYLA